MTRPIGPSDSVKEYVKETLALEKIRKSGKKTYEGSSIGATETKELSKRIRNNIDAKSRTIDNLFKSMANLTYFFEFINSHPELIDKYSEDIEDLFGLQSNSTNPNKSPFSHLIKAILGRGYGAAGYDDSNDEKFYFRRRLLPIIQFRINEKLKFYAIRSPKGTQDQRFFNMVYTDLERTDVWANFLDKYITDGNRIPRRKINLGQS